jgi:hypothetical protein
MPADSYHKRLRGIPPSSGVWQCRQRPVGEAARREMAIARLYAAFCCGSLIAVVRDPLSGALFRHDAVSHRSRFGPGAELRGLVCRRGRGRSSCRRLVLQGRFFRYPGDGLLRGRPSGGQIFVWGERNQDGCWRVRRACGHYTKQQDERGNEPHARKPGLIWKQTLSTDSKQKCKARRKRPRAESRGQGSTPVLQPAQRGGAREGSSL